jgi:HEPN domain-containing protein
VIDVTRKQLAKAARQRIEAAGHFVPRSNESLIPRPAVAAYLAHVGMECLLKAWLLLKNNADDTHQLRARLPEQEADELFSAKGHNLAALAEKASLKRHLVAENEPGLMDLAAWTRLANPPRPYNLRYGVLNLALDQAQEEVELALTVLRLVEKVLQ